jgi:hypothetical protein
MTADTRRLVLILALLAVGLALDATWWLLKTAAAGRYLGWW